MDHQCTISNWRKKYLTERQIKYAAMDAWVTFILFNIFENMDSCFDNIENVEKFSNKRKNILTSQFVLNGLSFKKLNSIRGKCHRVFKESNSDKSSYLKRVSNNKNYLCYSLRKMSKEQPKFLYPDFPHY